MDGRGGGAKHGGAVRSRGGRRQGRNTGPMAAGVSRKIVNTDWLEVDEGLTYLLLVDCYFHRIM